MYGSKKVFLALNHIKEISFTLKLSLNYLSGFFMGLYDADSSGTKLITGISLVVAVNKRERQKVKNQSNQQISHR